MTTYTTVAKVRANLPSAVASVTSVTSAVLANFIQQADSVINAAVANRYTVPVSGCALLETVAADLACARLLRRMFTGESKNSSGWAEQFSASMDLLKEVRAGTLALTTGSGTLIPTAGGGLVLSNNSSYTPTFAEDSAIDSFIDQHKLNDIESDREAAER